MGKKTKYLPLDWKAVSHTIPRDFQSSNSCGAHPFAGESQREDVLTRASDLIEDPKANTAPEGSVFRERTSPMSGSSNEPMDEYVGKIPPSTILAQTPISITETRPPMNDVPVKPSAASSEPIVWRESYGLQSASLPSLLSQASTCPPLPLVDVSSIFRLPTYHQVGKSRSRLLPRRLVGLPTIGKVYYLADRKNFPHSIIHTQKQQNGFFKHPVLVTAIEGELAYFYALTKAPPQAIGDLNMCLLLGSTTADQGIHTLRLDEGSSSMQTETWVNLEQRYYMEWTNLFEWAIDVRSNPDNLWKLAKRIYELEADQNRYIYKPLPRDMSIIRLGTVLMLCNDNHSSTLGAPVLVVENQYPYCRFFRIKLFKENINFNPDAKRNNGQPRHMCLEITKKLKIGHDNTPVMLVETDCQEMREPSYVEVFAKTQVSSFNLCKTWCWPPIVIREDSMQVLKQYMACYGGSNRTYTRRSQQPSNQSSVPSTPHGLSSMFLMPTDHHGNFYNPHGSMLPSPAPYHLGSQYTQGMYPPQILYQAHSLDYNMEDYPPHSSIQFSSSMPSAGMYHNDAETVFDVYGRPYWRCVPPPDDSPS